MNTTRQTTIIKYFINETERLKSLLLSIKQKFDALDKTSPNLQQQIDMIEKSKNGVFEDIDGHFFNIWTIYKDLASDIAKEHRIYFQKQLVPLFSGSPYNRRVYEKPLGYAGDYIMMLSLYNNEYEGDTTYEKFVHRYSMRIPTAIANRNRKDFYKEHINSALDVKPDAKITSIASGPAIEMIETLKEHPRVEQAVFSCLDFEKQALEYIKEQINDIRRDTGRTFTVNFIHSDIKTLLKNGKIDRVLDDQDLIYCSGLIDYFNDRTASKMIEVLFHKLNDGGELIVGNVSDMDKFMAYTEVLGEWYVNHRSKDNMLKLTANLNGAITKIGFEKETQMNIFLIIKKHGAE